MLARLEHGAGGASTVEPDFRDIMVRCRGMLAPAIYRNLYAMARDRPGGWIVEVGTASGAATVALALGLRDSGRPGRLMTFGRVQRCGREETLRIIREALERYGVADLVDIVLGEVADTASALPTDVRIGALMLDADGRIDRDFLAFYDRLLPGAAVAIDDVRDVALVRKKQRGGYAIDAKRLLTHRLLDHFRTLGLVSEGALLKDTWFGRKTGDGSRPLDLLEVLGIYRQLVFMEARKTPALRKWAVATLDRFCPSLMNRFRADYRDRVAARPTVSRADPQGVFSSC